MANSFVVEWLVPYQGNIQPRITKSLELGHGFNQPRFGAGSGVDRTDNKLQRGACAGIDSTTMVKRRIESTNQSWNTLFCEPAQYLTGPPAWDRTNATALTITPMEIHCHTHVSLQEKVTPL